MPFLQFTVRASSPEPPVTQVPSQNPVCNRRTAHLHLATSLAAATYLTSSPPAAASLVRFPVCALNNRYFLVRAGESESESQGYVLTNPVSKTSMSNALSTKGRRQVIKETYPALEALGACEGACWMWPSMTQNSYQTAEILAALYGIGRNRIVPEFSKLDARGLGAFEGGQWEVVAAEVASGDESSADWKAPRGENGTPNESATEVLVRGRELLSLLETQYFGENVLLISPDSDNLSILQAGVLGVDLRGHGKYALGPGEVRKMELSTLERDDSPRQIPCPHPPQCR